MKNTNNDYSQILNLGSLHEEIAKEQERKKGKTLPIIMMIISLILIGSGVFYPQISKLIETNKNDKDKTVVKKNGAEMQKKAMKEAPVLTHHLQKSIMLEITDGGMTAEVESTAEYAGYQEYGTRFMKGKPHIRPAFDEQKGKFKSDLGKLVR